MSPLPFLLPYSPRSDTQGDIWGAGSEDDFQATTAKTGEPIIRTMAPEGSPELPKFDLPNVSMSAYQLWQLQKKRIELRKKHLDFWEATKALTGTGRPVDAIISPVAPYTAPPHGRNT